LASNAIITFLTCCIKWYNNFVANIEIFYCFTFLFDGTYELMATNEIWWTLEMTTIEVKIRATKGCRGNFEDSIGGLLEFGVWSILDGHLERYQVSDEDY
jgi:hypothetical protein